MSEPSPHLWRNATLIAGPTASGKSALALDIAQQKDGVIINTDSMQVYDVLRVLTARPDAQDLSQVPHYLYGHLQPTCAYSTGHWLSDVKHVLSTFTSDRHIVFVGGTGLYFRALLGGLSPIPEVADDIRQYWRDKLEGKGAEALHEILISRDPKAAETLGKFDGQRIVRALEVLESSGQSIIYWQQQKGVAIVDDTKVERIIIEPDRGVLKKRIHSRFDHMIDRGALDEVLTLKALDIDPSMPAMKAIGVPQLIDYIDKKITLDEAIELSKTATRQYAKRQMTWFRNQLDHNWKRISFSENACI